ncbi:FadR/GntR family transcriptional regulator [Pseudoruegeria sp. SHC-113]|uniref:FadR/GntR family transcriptional regulator n=1 Tax=Pseudoruegeria sp. SHC-113 TaxID=2855439 RepID=UPI0021BB9166|nr:FadR/GntR family transcriptional regulator [Pseudoruegeria sp. SHC-113]MCT8159956.1 FadR family transcriptional regulator [Pseudoruegeria sp. SHC-113]
MPPSDTDLLLSRSSAFSRSLAGQLARDIGERILSGSLAPGQLLPDENALCEEFDVSRTVVREGVKLLVSKGLLEVRQRVGTRVQDVRNWQMLDRDVLMWHQSIQIDGARLQSLMELRQSIEPDAAFHAATRRSDTQLAAIVAASERLSEHAGENSKYVLADATFHIAVLRAANNPYLDALESAIFTGLMLSIRITNPDEARNLKSVPLHKSIADAIVAQDATAARAHMQTHLEDAAARLTQGLAAQGASGGR